MKIGFDAKRLFLNKTGLGNYARSLVQSLTEFFPNHEYLLFTPEVTRSDASDYFLSNKHCKTIVPAKNTTFWRLFGMVRDVEAQKIDIYHGLSNEIPIGMHKKVKTIVTIHDIIYKHYPHTYSLIDRLIYDYKTKYACQNSHVIIAASEATKQDIIRFYGIAEEKIKVIYQACNEVFYQDTDVEIPLDIRTMYSLPTNYMLYVGSVIERKNAMVILEAMLLLAKEQRIPLVIVGKGKEYKQKMLRFIQENALENHMIWISHLEDVHILKKLYQNARVFIYPSHAEGFGIPLIEAMLCKTPVITSNVSSLKEIGAEHVFQIDPTNPKELASTIESIRTKDQTERVQKAFEYVHMKYNPHVLSEKYMGVYLL